MTNALPPVTDFRYQNRPDASQAGVSGTSIALPSNRACSPSACSYAATGIVPATAGTTAGGRGVAGVCVARPCACGRADMTATSVVRAAYRAYRGIRVNRGRVWLGMARSSSRDGVSASGGVPSR